MFLRWDFTLCFQLIFQFFGDVYTPPCFLVLLFEELISPNNDVADPINSYSEVYSSSPGCYFSSARWFWWICTINCSIMLTDGEAISFICLICLLLKIILSSIDNFAFLPQILVSSPDDAVEPILLNLSIRLRNLQVRQFTFNISSFEFYSVHMSLHPHATVSDTFLL